MDLHQIANPVITAVNSNEPASLQVSTGWTTGAQARRTPTYATPVTITVQVQALTFRDIQQIDGLNLQGTRRALYVYGQIDGLVRVTNKGGDLITITTGINAGVWLVAIVLESWRNWAKCACTLQDQVPT